MRVKKPNRIVLWDVSEMRIYTLTSYRPRIGTFGYKYKNSKRMCSFR